MKKIKCFFALVSILFFLYSPLVYLPSDVPKPIHGETNV